MAKKNICITENDMKRLRELIMTARYYGREEEKYLKELEDELDKAKIMKSQDIPQDIITMNSTIHLVEMDSGEETTYTLVFPDMADISKNKISIMAPIGTALIGYRIGDIIEWEVPAGLVKLKVKKILYQPEAVGDYHL